MSTLVGPTESKHLIERSQGKTGKIFSLQIGLLNLIINSSVFTGFACYVFSKQTHSTTAHEAPVFYRGV